MQRIAPLFNLIGAVVIALSILSGAATIAAAIRTAGTQISGEPGLSSGIYGIEVELDCIYRSMRGTISGSICH